MKQFLHLFVANARLRRRAFLLVAASVVVGGLCLGAALRGGVTGMGGPLGRAERAEWAAGDAAGGATAGGMVGGDAAGGNAAGGNAAGGSAAGGNAAGGSATGGSAAGGSAAGGSATNGGTAGGGLTDGSAANGSTTGDTAYGSAASGAANGGAASDGAASGGSAGGGSTDSSAATGHTTGIAVGDSSCGSTAGGAAGGATAGGSTTGGSLSNDGAARGSAAGDTTGGATADGNAAGNPRDSATGGTAGGGSTGSSAAGNSIVGGATSGSSDMAGGIATGAPNGTANAAAASQPPALAHGADALAGVLVAIDPGHGGYDGGARCRDSGVWEKELNLQIALRVEEALRAYGADVLLTRREDVALHAPGTAPHARKRADLQARRDLAEQAGADLLLSIHLNEYRSRAESGPQTFYQRGADAGRLLAAAVQARLVEGLRPARVRVAMAGDYYVLRGKLPSALVECGFISHAEEERLLRTEAYQRRVAEAVALGVCDYRALEARRAGKAAGENAVE